MGASSDATPDGPTLYLETDADALDPAESFCTAVFDDDDVAGEYRVVQLTSTGSFDSVRDALDVQLERINDPSEAAVIITTPASESESTVTRVGEETPLYGFWVDPDDLTGISVAFSRLLERWEGAEGATKICLRDLESLLPYHDSDLVYRFLNTVLATLQGAGADVHVHLRPAATDEQTLYLLSSLFDRVVDPAESKLETGSPAGGTGDATASGGPARPTAGEGDPVDVAPAAMDDDEIDEFLRSEGHGILAFAGEPPYAVPMSYGYDADERVAYVHLSRFDGSEKAARLADSGAVSLVVSRYARPDRWRSVVVDGSLTRLSDEAARERGAVDAFAGSDLASVDVFNRDLSDISFDWYALEPSSMSGRRSTGSL
jgi:nitroimidazol reductase NimA-like FMN-containing flavoprotein (pyridoxamine 5'-phosphate oxidase superfamily)